MARLAILLAMMFLPAAAALGAALTGLEQMEVATFAELREVERYQLKIAEKHYLAEELCL